MRQLFFSLTLACIFCLTTPTIAQEVIQSQEPTIEEKFTRALDIVSKSSVSVIQVFDTGGLTYCTGTLISNEEKEPVVITAKHCLSNMSNEIYVDGVSATAYFHDTNFDIAFIYLSEKIEGKEPIKLATKEAKLRELVFVFAYPPKHDPYIDVGIVNLKTGKNHYAKLKVFGGCSGGGVYNIKGELVGVLWGSVGDMMIFTPVSEIKNILLKNNIRYTIANY